MKLSPLEQDVVNIVQSLQPASGAMVHDRLQEINGHQVSSGAVYTVLSRLEDKKVLISAWGKSSKYRGGRRQRLYSTVEPTA